MKRGIFLLVLVASLLLALAPPAVRAQASEVWVCPSGSCQGAPAFTTIQAGIDAVDPRGTVHVEAGSYTGSLAIGKALTLQGAGAALCEVRGALRIDAAGVAVHGFRLTGASDGYIVRLAGANNAVLEDNTLTGLRGTGDGYGLLVANTAGAACRRLTIGDINVAGVAAGILLDAGANQNTFEALTVDGIVSTGTSAYGVRLNTALQGNTFTNLAISNVTAAAGAMVTGVSVAGGSGQLFNSIDIGRLQGHVARAVELVTASSTTVRGLRFDGSGTVATGNTEGVYIKSGSGIAVEAAEIDHTTRGIVVDGGSASVSNCSLLGNDRGVLLRSNGTAVLRDNAIVGNTYGIESGVGSAADATGNWWGSPTGPKISANPGGLGDPFTGGVTFGPWLGDGTDTSADRGFQPNPTRYAIPTRLAFSTQPGRAAAGQPLAPQPVVQAQDEAGNLGYNCQQAVTLSIGTNPAGGTPSGSTTVTTTNGTAAFGGLSIDKIGSGYTLVAKSANLAMATSAPFDITGAAPVLTSIEPGHATAGSGALSLTVRGTGLAPDARVNWNGAPRSTASGSPGQLVAQLEAGDLAAAGTAAVTVLNPDGQESNALAFTIRPVPALVWVDAAWAGLPADSDPDGDGPARHLGYDAFADVQAAMDAVAGGGSIHVAAGTYAGGLTVSTAGLTIDLNGAVVGAGSPAFTVTADDVTIDDGVLDGTGDTTGASAIVVGAGVSRLWVHGCEIRNWPADGIHLNGVVTGLKIMDNDIHDNGGDGIEVNGTPAGTVLVAGNSFRNNGGYGINAVSGSLCAEYNAWGHIEGAAAGDGTSGAVDADPWLFGRLAVHVAAEPAQVHEGETVDVVVRAGAASLYGAQLTLAYDPARLEVVSVTAEGEGYFAGTLGAEVSRDDAAGTVRYSATRQAGEAALNGEAQLLGVRFRARAIDGAQATTGIAIDPTSVRLAAPGGVGIRPDSLAGDSLTILGATAVSGVVRLQGRGDWSGAQVDALPGATFGTDPAAVTTDAWGRYAFLATDDRYIVIVAMARYLSARAEVEVGGGSTTLSTVELLGGDADGDGRVGINDITSISGLLFGAKVDAAATPADINADGWVDILDLALAAGNYGLNSSTWEA